MYFYGYNFFEIWAVFKNLKITQKRFERKINAGFVLNVSELVKKHASSNILLNFKHKKKVQFCSKKSILRRAATSILIPNNNLWRKSFEILYIYYICRYKIVGGRTKLLRPISSPRGIPSPNLWQFLCWCWFHINRTHLMR